MHTTRLLIDNETYNGVETFDFKVATASHEVPSPDQKRALGARDFVLHLTGNASLINLRDSRSHRITVEHYDSTGNQYLRTTVTFTHAWEEDGKTHVWGYRNVHSPDIKWRPLAKLTPSD